MKNSLFPDPNLIFLKEYYSRTTSDVFTKTSIMRHLLSDEKYNSFTIIAHPIAVLKKKSKNHKDGLPPI